MMSNTVRYGAAALAVSALAGCTSTAGGAAAPLIPADAVSASAVRPEPAKPSGSTAASTPPAPRKDFRLKYRGAASAPPRAAAAVRDLGKFWHLLYAAYGSNRKDRRYLGYLKVVDPLSGTTGLRSAPHKWDAKHIRPIGTARIVVREVLAATPTSVTLTACGDESGLNAVDLSTGAITPGTLGQAHWQMVITMVPAGDRWAVSRYATRYPRPSVTDSGTPACR